MKKLFVLAIVAVALTIFNGCQKDELKSQLNDEAQPQAVVKPDLYVEGDYLVFKDFSVLDSLKTVMNSKSFEYIQNFETGLGFKSAFSYRKELLKKADELPESGIANYLDEVIKQGYFDKQNQEFVYPFYNESYARVLNPNGKVKIGKIFYQFEGTTEIVTPDFAGVEFNGDSKELEHRIQLNSGFPQLKSGEMLKETMLSDNRLRCLLQLKREEYVAYDWIIVNGQIVWGIVGNYWQVYYRFYSYKQYRFYKSDRSTYFNWKTKQAQIGGNDDYWYLNYYNANPYTERSTSQQAVYYFTIYDSGLIQSQYPPTVSAVQVSDFWSDYMSSFHGTLTYP